MESMHRGMKYKKHGGRKERGRGGLILLESLDSAMSEAKRTSGFFRYNNAIFYRDYFGLNCNIQLRILSNIYVYLDNPNMVSSLMNV